MIQETGLPRKGFISAPSEVVKEVKRQVHNGVVSQEGTSDIYFIVGG